MRTAEEIMQESISDARAYSIDPFEVFEKMQVAGKLAINKARREAIEELASKTYISDNNFHPVITKEEIISLINELK